MAQAGRVELDYLRRPGFHLRILIAPRGSGYRLTLDLNGAVVHTCRRPSLASGLRWAYAHAARVVELFGMSPRTLRLVPMIREIRARLAA